MTIKFGMFHDLSVFSVIPSPNGNVVSRSRDSMQ